MPLDLTALAQAADELFAAQARQVGAAGRLAAALELPIGMTPFAPASGLSLVAREAIARLTIVDGRPKTFAPMTVAAIVRAAVREAARTDPSRTSVEAIARAAKALVANGAAAIASRAIAAAYAARFRPPAVRNDSIDFAIRGVRPITPALREDAAALCAIGCAVSVVRDGGPAHRAVDALLLAIAAPNGNLRGFTAADRRTCARLTGRALTVTLPPGEAQAVVDWITDAIAARDAAMRLRGGAT